MLRNVALVGSLLLALVLFAAPETAGALATKGADQGRDDSGELFKTGDWGPDGHGVLVQTMSLSVDGNTLDSRISVQLFDKDGKRLEGGGEGTATPERIRF